MRSTENSNLNTFAIAVLNGIPYTYTVRLEIIQTGMLGVHVEQR